MVRRFVLLTTAFIFLVSGYGCGIKARAYVAERERVDQANTGNAGFIKGQGGTIAGRPTRKVYVVEFEREKKPAKKPDVKSAPQETKAETAQPPQEVQAAAPSQEEAPVQVSEAATPEFKVTSYTVEKDDTLQKISKKVYGSFNKWTKIYEANRERIKNPNYVKPGTVLTIPQD